MRTFLLAFLLTLTAVKPVSIRVSRTVFGSPGGDITVICTVPRHADNRIVTAVLSNYTSSEHQLDGEASAVTHRFEFKHLPCDVTEAICRLTDRFGRHAADTQLLEILGCNQ